MIQCLVVADSDMWLFNKTNRCKARYLISPKLKQQSLPHPPNYQTALWIGKLQTFGTGSSKRKKKQIPPRPRTVKLFYFSVFLVVSPWLCLRQQQRESGRTTGSVLIPVCGSGTGMVRWGITCRTGSWVRWNHGCVNIQYCQDPQECVFLLLSVSTWL